MRRAAVERTTYVGKWLPEPLAAGAHWAADHRLGMQSDLSMAFLVLLERLAPEERAAFLLREVFDEDYAAIAEILDKTEAAVRQIVHRARQRVRTDRSRVRIEPDARRRLLRSFLTALAEDDKDAVLAMVAPDATFTSDGGGKAQAAINVLVGSGRVASMFLGIEAKWPLRHREVDINGEPGILSYAGDRLIAATAFEIVDGRILNVYRVMNPDKLRFAAPSGPG